MPPTLSDFDFELPPALIAQRPAASRSASRLLHLRRGTDGRPQLDDRVFGELPSLLRAGDLLVFNDSRVIPARMHGHKSSGGRVELLVERILGPAEAVVQLRASKPPQPGSTLRFGEAVATVLGRDGGFWTLRFDRPLGPLLEAIGRLPLPPYIEHEPDAADRLRYQTVYAREPGSVAAPTAGLHFDEALLAALAEAGVKRAFVTLHVGAGTFAPVRTENLAEHRMHVERCRIDEAAARAIADTRTAGGRVIAVGTTALRTLESAADESGAITPGVRDTDIFITPGYRFRVVDRLLTNFHLPRSTLLMLVAAFAGLDTIRYAYAHAIAQGYRFFSYGDAMLLDVEPGTTVC
ncbi:MAG: tRNA preQ1(34) S-adenosylmethionine ribosyltransferase-isomerase QueA [Burkholderiaceae bacterium]|nr:tRNA preQ1(34) S-adenosylmethionine ribosyltransferase-isomerase QueA [Burkholderiaceae bacterium]MEB2319639.1 tRNA preQ1(34) S-adenosylmethionine ribosyltransferase-isomerase QueA [Pseudomonadota bacterium]